MAGGAIGGFVVWLLESQVFKTDMPIAADAGVVMLCVLLLGFVIRPDQGP